MATYGKIGQFSAIEHNQMKQKPIQETIGYDTIEINLVSASDHLHKYIFKFSKTKTHK